MKGLIFLILAAPFLGKAQRSVNIIPQPVLIQYQQGKFVLSGSTSIQYNVQQNDLMIAAEYLNTQVKNIISISLPVNATRPTTIQLSIEKIAAIGDEGYKMEILPSKISIKANSKAGIAYGIQSLLQLFPVSNANEKLEIPCMKITDYPRFKYRGMHLDVGRHFYPVSFIKKYIDFFSHL